MTVVPQIENILLQHLLICEYFIMSKEVSIESRVLYLVSPALDLKEMCKITLKKALPRYRSKRRRYTTHLH